MNKSRVLILVDAQSMYYGLRSTKGYEKRKVDFKLLKEELVSLTGNDSDKETIDLFAYLAHAPTQKGMSFFALLKKLGYTLKIKSYTPDDKGLSVISDMQMDLINNAAHYDQVMIVSGNGAFHPAFKAIKDNWDVETHIISFEHTLHGVYDESDVVDYVTDLNPEKVAMEL